jgi:hypothetical protein
MKPTCKRSADPERVEEYREKVRTMLMAPDLFFEDFAHGPPTKRGIAQRGP